VLSGPLDDVDELDAIGIYIHVIAMQLDHTLFLCTRLALCCDLKAAGYAQNYADIVFTSLVCNPYINYSRILHTSRPL